MDREEMRFQVFLRLFDGGCTDEHRQWAIEESSRLMEAFDKSRPDYVDPAKLEETIQARVLAALVDERVRTIRVLLNTRFIASDALRDETPFRGTRFTVLPDQLHHVLLGDLLEEERKAVLRVL